MVVVGVQYAQVFAATSQNCATEERRKWRLRSTWRNIWDGDDDDDDDDISTAAARLDRVSHAFYDLRIARNVRIFTATSVAIFTAMLLTMAYRTREISLRRRLRRSLRRRFLRRRIGREIS